MKTTIRADRGSITGQTYRDIHRRCCLIAIVATLGAVLQSHAALVGHWNFNEGTGTTANDSSGSAYHGTLSGSATLTPGPGISGGAVQISSAANGLVNMGNVWHLTNTSFTVQAWVKTASNDLNSIVVVAKHQSGNAAEWGLFLNENNTYGAPGKAMVYQGSSPANSPVSTTTVTDGSWHQILAVYELGGQCKIYVDGQLENAIAAFPFGANDAPLLVGALQTGAPQNSFNGYVDEIQIYDTALSNAQVQYLYQHPGQTAPLAVPEIILLGTNSITNECFNALSDPGVIARNVVQPLGSTYRHTLAVRADRTVAAWGANSAGAADVPAAATNAVGVVAGTSHSVVLRADGTILAWGNNSYGQLNIPVAATPAIAIAGSYYHNLALRPDGTVVAWGSNFEGETSVPSSATNVVAIAANNYFSLALRRDGTVIGWGSNGSGQTSIPAAATNVVALAPGGTHCLALRRDGSVIGWGDNFYDQTTIPAAATNIIAIAAGAYHNLALRADGTLVAWGYNLHGETDIPAGANNIIAIVAGEFHSAALRADGTVIAWGWNNEGQTNVPTGLTGATAGRVITRTAFNPGVLGAHPLYYTVTGAFGGTATATRTVVNRDTTPPVLTLSGDNPLTISSPSAYVEPGATAADLCAGVAAITGGFGSSLALRSDGSAVAWGSAAYHIPSVPAAATNLVAIGASSTVGLGLRRDGSVLVWGLNNSGQFSVPAGATNIVALGAGMGEHILALSGEGTVIAWGRNLEGQCNVPADLTNVVAVAAGAGNCLALQSDGRVRGWGNEVFLGSVPTSATNIVRIASGGNQCLALRSDGTVLGWGYDSYGETIVPPGLGNVVKVAAGEYFSMALREDGSVVCWGDNSTGQTNVPAAATNVVDVAGGYNHALALRADGLIIGWGDNSDLQATAPSWLSDAITNITITGAITSGTNTLTYTAIDPSGNTGTVQRTVIVTAPPANPLTLTKQSAKVSFSKPLADSTSFTANIGLPDDFAPSNKVVTVNIAGVSTDFTLDAKGKCKLLTGSSCAFKKNKLGGWIITVKLGKGNYAAAWDDDGLKNETVADKPVTLPVTVTANSQAFTGSKPLLYKATEDKSGSAK